MVLLFLVYIPLVLASRNCFFCSRSRSSDDPSIADLFASTVQSENGPLFARDGSSLERAEQDSSISMYGSLGSMSPFESRLNRKKRGVRRRDPLDIFESYDPLEQMEEDYPLCRYFDRRLRSPRSKRYIPAIRWSRVFGGPGQNCRRSDFRIGSVLGKGAFGKVVKATHISTGKSVALKYINYDPEELAALSEIRQEECLQHRMEDFRPVARHYCTFDIMKGEEMYAVLVLEHIQGEELFHVIHGNSPRWPVYTDDNLLTWTAQLILILRELHARNVVVLDLKPENLILEPNGNLRLIDFGLAGDPTRPSGFSFGINSGTPMYYPPEFIQEDGDGSDEVEESWPLEDRHQFGTDWYCLGLTLYEILYREAPFDSHDEAKLYHQIKYQGVSLKPAETQRGTDLADLIAGFCDRNRWRRLGVHQDTEELLEGHPFFQGINIDTFKLLYRKS